MLTFLCILAVYIACIVFVRVRNKVKFSLIRQLSDFSTFMVPFNIPAYLLSKIPLSSRIENELFS